jgi:hypothetical protein
MTVLPPYLAVMVASHLTETETRFLYCTSPILSDHIHWEDLFMSTSLCLYGLHRMSEYSIEFLMAIVTTASYDDIQSPAITALLCCHLGSAKHILYHTIKAHRPLPMLAYLFQLYSCSCRGSCADDFCDMAARSHNRRR